MSDKKRPSFESIYMKFCEDIAQRSTCDRLKVGCVITSADFTQVFSVGYNGGAAGVKDDNDCTSDGKGGCLHLHAECNALIKCNVSKSEPKFLFCTHNPCIMCSKLIINSGGVKKVYYKAFHKTLKGVEMMRQVGIEVIQLL